MIEITKEEYTELKVYRERVVRGMISYEVPATMLSLPDGNEEITIRDTVIACHIEGIYFKRG